MLETTAIRPRAPRTGQRVWLRIVLALLISTAASTFIALRTVHQAVEGSYTAFLLVIPLLGALIASGIRPSPGVGDTEFDWILAVIFAAAGLLAIRLLSQRLPACAGMWHWDHFTAVVWAMATAMVLFSVRHVLRLWRVWVFALCAVPAMPFLLVTAHLGGTEDSAVLAGAALGTIAVFLATSTFEVSRRLLAAAVNLAVAVGLDQLLGWDGTLLRTVVIAGLFPVLTVAAVRRAAHVRIAASLAAHPAKGTAHFPKVGTRSYGVLVLIAAALLASSPPVSAVQPPPVAKGDWIAGLNLERTADYPFISRFLGPGATLTRYALRTPEAGPAVAIDVITAPNLGRLTDYDDALWYPSPTPVNFRPVALAGVAARTFQSDPDLASASASEQWYALTWLWRTSERYQRVTVVVNQDPESDSPPPAPQPLSWANSLLRPMLWLTRQQPAPTGVVAKRVSRTGTLVAERIIEAGVPR